MAARRTLFPNVLELNYQARRRFGCAVYLVFSDSEWALIDIGYEDTVDEIIEMIRTLDFRLANCRYLIATHADVDHIQGLEKAKQLLPSAEIIGHSGTAKALADGDRILTYAEISAQGISIDLPKITVERTITEGDVLSIGDVELDVWHTPGHTDNQLSFRMGDLLFSGDNIYRDGGVGNIDAHHGSDIPHFIESLQRIKNSDVQWLLPSHGPVFRKDDALLQAAIERLDGYQHLSDFGTCAIDWPMLDEWDEELAKNINPTES